MSEHFYFDSDVLAFSFRQNVFTGIASRFTIDPWLFVVECEDPVGPYFEAFA